MSEKCARLGAAGTFQVNTGHMASSSSSSWRKSRCSTVRWWTLGAALPQKQRTASLSRVRDEERNVENFMLCSFAHFACSPILQAFLHEEEMCKVASHFSLDVLFPLSELSGCFFLRSIRPLLQNFFE